MTTEPQEGEPTPPPPNGAEQRRRFDDVASLFGTIVPGAGTPVRPPRPFRPIPTSLPEQVGPPILKLPPRDPEPPPAEPAASEPPPPPASPVPRMTEPLVARPAPKEVPWPDAFEPRPNYRKREPRRWSWLLLFPAGLIAAAAVTLLDTRSLRNWVDANVLHRTPSISEPNSSLLPAPFRPDASQGPPVVAPESDDSQQPIPYPAIPTSPVPVPPGTAVSPPPDRPEVAQPAAPSAAAHVTIQYRRNAPGADGEARRIAALLHDFGGSVELRAAPATQSAPTITYYNAADKGTANALAATLANEAAAWTVRLGTGKNPAGTLDVSLP